MDLYFIESILCRNCPIVKTTPYDSLELNGAFIDIQQPVIFFSALFSQAKVAELADAPDLGSGTERCGGSSPPFRTMEVNLQHEN
jgi:hypothetical protein